MGSEPSCVFFVFHQIQRYSDVTLNMVQIYYKLLILYILICSVSCSRYYMCIYFALHLHARAIILFGPSVLVPN